MKVQALRNPKRGPIVRLMYVKYPPADGKFLASCVRQTPSPKTTTTPTAYARTECAPARLTTKGVKKNAAMAGAMCVMFCIIAPLRRREPALSLVSATQTPEASTASSWRALDVAIYSLQWSDYQMIRPPLARCQGLCTARAAVWQEAASVTVVHPSRTCWEGCIVSV